MYPFEYNWTDGKDEKGDMDIEKFWEDVITQNRAALPSYFHKDAVIRWHCSNEQFNVEEYVRVNCDYPNEWEGEIERIEKFGDTMVLVGRVYPTDKSASFHVVSFMKLKDGLICELDEYWAEDGAPPAWREAMRIGKPLR